MAHDRYDNRDERSRWRDERSDREFRGRGRGDEDRGFFERAGDEIASWFGDDEAERRRHEDQRFEGRDRGWGRDERPRFEGRERGWDRGRSDRDDDGGFMSSSGYRGGSGYRGFGGDTGQGSMWSGERFSHRDREQRSLGRSTYGEPSPEADFLGAGRGDREPYAGDQYRRGSFSGAERSGRNFDPHYSSWRQRQIDELDRDYDDYRRENQSRFESEFGSWRERRMQKRGLMSQVREHMEVVGSDDQHVGTVDRVAGDRIILAKSDPESGGVHHSLSCADIDRVEGDKVILDCTAEQAKQRWRDESRGRALFEREDQGDMGDRVLDRSFEGTYR
jgi:hypothetical protein